MDRDDADPFGEDARRDTEPIPGMAHPEEPEGTSTGSSEGGRPRSAAPSGDPLEIPPPPEPHGAAQEEPDDVYDSTGLPPAGPRRVLPVEPEPSAFVARYLFPTEKYRGEWRRHWIHLLVPILVVIVSTFLMGFVSSMLAHYNARIAVTGVVLLWILALLWVAWKVSDWFVDRFILTNKRVMLISGLVTRKVAMMPLVRVTDMKYQQSPLGRMLSYGTFVLESAGQDQALREVPHLPNPNELYLRVVEEMYEPEAVEARLGNGEGDMDGSEA